MATKLNLTSQKILDEVFPGVPRGYDPLLVDQFLDKVIQDYLIIENNELINKQEIDALRNELARLKEENLQLTVENGRLTTSLGGIKDNPNVNRGNIELMRRVDKLEKILYAHHIDPDAD